MLRPIALRLPSIQYSSRAVFHRSTRTLHHTSRQLSTLKPSPNENENPSFGATGWRETYKNSSRGTKIVLMGGLSLLATAETVAWCTWGWNKWGPRKENVPKSESG